MADVSFLWKIGGEAGFGIMTTGMDFAKLAARMGYHTADYAEYPSLIRGGHNTYEVHISDEPIYSSKKPVDLLVCLNKETFETHKKRLHSASIVLFDADAFEISECPCPYLHIPLQHILRENDGSIVHMNTIMMGAVMGIMQWPLELVNNMISETFSRKGDDVVHLNKLMAQKGYDYVEEHYSEKRFKNIPPGVSALSSAQPNMQHAVTSQTESSNQPHSEETTKALQVTQQPRSSEEKSGQHDYHLIMTGNDAFCIGAVAADCRLYVAYPMTPSSTVLTRMAEWARTTGMVVRHAEDEISVINTAIGGAFAGIRAACGTSGGGFALMTEAVSFAGITETPLVIFMSQRPGPATGLPTWTEQGDVLFTTFAGHGEFPKIVLAPGDVEEMYELTAEAFNLADVYQTPVIVMSDKHLSESHWSISGAKLDTFLSSFKVNRGKITRSVQMSDGEGYMRYSVSDDGVSPMLIPGQKGVFFQANSYEHEEDGHTTESAFTRIQQVDKRNKKESTYLMNHYKGPNAYGDTGIAQHVFVSWGSNKGVVLDAMKRLKNEGVETALVHFNHIWPLDKHTVGGILTNEIASKSILVENNSHAQFGKLLKMVTGFEPARQFLKYDGRQIFVEDVIEFVRSVRRS